LLLLLLLLVRRPCLLLLLWRRRRPHLLLLLLRRRRPHLLLLLRRRRPHLLLLLLLLLLGCHMWLPRGSGPLLLLLLPTTLLWWGCRCVGGAVPSPQQLQELCIGRRRAWGKRVAAAQPALGGAAGVVSNTSRGNPHKASPHGSWRPLVPHTASRLQLLQQLRLLLLQRCNLLLLEGPLLLQLQLLLRLWVRPRAAKCAAGGTQGSYSTGWGHLQ
jgi:hypothetical protein